MKKIDRWIKRNFEPNINYEIINDKIYSNDDFCANYYYQPVRIPYKLGKVNRFSILSEKLKTLENFPDECAFLYIRNAQIRNLINIPKVTQDISIMFCNYIDNLEEINYDVQWLIVSYCNLSSLKYFPKAKKYDFSHNKLDSLNGISETDYLVCSDNKITSLNGVKLTGNNIYFACNNNKLTSFNELKYNGDFNMIFCDYNLINSFSWFPKVVKTLFCSNNNISSLEGCPEKIEYLIMDNNPLKSLKGLSKIEITKRFKWDQLNINFENQYRLQVMQDLIASGYEV